MKRKMAPQQDNGASPFNAVKGLLDHNNEDDFVSDGRPSTEGGAPNKKGRNGKYNQDLWLLYLLFKAISFLW
jgi:hypothetical protein